MNLASHPMPPRDLSLRRDAARRRRVRAAIVVALWVAASPAAAKLVVMHGPAEPSSAVLWIQADAAVPVTVSWRADGETNEHTLELAALGADDHVVVARLTGLQPGGTATYRLRAGDDRREGTVKTQPRRTPDGDAADLTIAVGSCFFLPDGGPLPPGREYGSGFGIFDAIAAQRPDLMLWLGDNVYLQPPDLHDPAAMAARYRRQRAFEPLQTLLTATTHLAIWDDHDYGPNNGDASFALKGEALKLFRRYWPNPGAGLPTVPGTFGVASYGDVTFFLLDDRYYRSPNRQPDDPYKTMFGARQLEWLQQALVSAPRSSIKIVAGGSQFWTRAGRFEGWQHFASERRRFAAWLAAQKIDGVFFLSGDRHFTELLKIERPDAYPLYEFTSSPLTSRPPARLDAADRDNPDVVPGTQVAARQFGLIRVTGPGSDRRLTFESRDSTGALLWRHQLRVNSLRAAGARDPRT
jgi:alkaline phosphatase D